MCAVLVECQKEHQRGDDERAAAKTQQAAESAAEQTYRNKYDRSAISGFLFEEFKHQKYSGKTSAPK